MDINEQTTQDNRYQSIPPQGTSDIARGMGLLKTKKRRQKLNNQRAQKDSDKSVNCEQEDR